MFRGKNGQTAAGAPAIPGAMPEAKPPGRIKRALFGAGRGLRFGFRKTTQYAPAVGGTIATGVGYAREKIAKGTAFAMRDEFLSKVFVFAVLIVAVFDILRNFEWGIATRASIYFGLWVLAWAFVWEDRSPKMLLKSLPVAAAPFLAPFAINFLTNVIPVRALGGDVVVSAVITIMSISWIWVFAARGQGFANKIAGIVGVALLLSLWGATILPIFQTGGALQIQKEFGTVANAPQKIVNAVKNAGKIFTPTAIKAEYEKIKNYTGGNFETQIEKSIGEPLGVKILSSKVRYGTSAIPQQDQTISPTFPANEPVAFSVPIEIVARRNLDLIPFCRTNTTKGIVDGQATINSLASWPFRVPEEGIKIIDPDREIRCTFAPGQLNGTNEVRFGAEFEWKTDTSLLRYFLDRDWALGKTRQGIDPLDSLKIVDKKPAAKTTPGPAEFEVSTSPQYAISVPRTQENVGVPIIHFRLKRTETSEYSAGIIRNMTSVVVQFPEGLELNEVSCAPNRFISQGQITDERGVKYNTYAMDLTKKVENIKGTSPDFACELKPPNAQVLLGDNLAAFVTIRASSTYIFSAEKTLTINVRRS